MRRFIRAQSIRLHLRSCPEVSANFPQTLRSLFAIALRSTCSFNLSQSAFTILRKISVPMSRPSVLIYTYVSLFIQESIFKDLSSDRFISAIYVSRDKISPHRRRSHYFWRSHWSAAKERVRSTIIDNERERAA